MEDQRQPDLITNLLDAVERGDVNARQELFSAVLDELRGIAVHQMATDRTGHTLQPTALVSEAYLSIFGSRTPQFTNRGHFFSAVAKAMHDIRVDYARKNNAQKRGGDRVRVFLDEDTLEHGDDSDLVIAVSDALESLRKLDSRKATLVTLRFFGGFTMADCAEALKISLSTANSDWRLTKSWLRRELSDGAAAPPGNDAG